MHACTKTYVDETKFPAVNGRKMGGRTPTGLCTVWPCDILFRAEAVRFCFGTPSSRDSRLGGLMVLLLACIFFAIPRLSNAFARCRLIKERPCASCMAFGKYFCPIWQIHFAPVRDIRVTALAQHLRCWGSARYASGSGMCHETRCLASTTVHDTRHMEVGVKGAVVHLQLAGRRAGPAVACHGLVLSHTSKRPGGRSPPLC